jgi:hypothetical protein
MPEENEPKIQWKRINGSSNVDQIGYTGGNLYIKFKPTGTYVYYHVPKNIHTRLLRSPSKGKFIHRFIRDIYDYDRLSVY